MAKLFLFIGLVAFVSKLNAQSKVLDIIKYHYKITLSNTTDEIEVAAKIEGNKLGSGALILDLVGYNKEKATGMVLLEANFNNAKIGWKYDGNKVVFEKLNNYIGAFTIEAKYKGIPKDGLIISKNKFGERTFFADNWPNRAQHWLLCNDNIADKALVDFTVFAPKLYTIVSNGIQVNKDSLGDNYITSFNCKVPLPTKVMVIGAAPFATEQVGVVDNIPVSSYVFKKDSANAFSEYSYAPKILTWFIKNIGPYNYPKLDNIQSKTIFGGMENASAIFYNEESISNNHAYEDLLAHEIAHQWFGNTVTESNYKHLWLSEGFATYFASLYMRHSNGEANFLNRVKDEMGQVYANPAKQPIVNDNKNYMSLLNSYSYQKGAWVLRTLHVAMGDTLFFKAIREYYAAYRNKNVNTDSFLNVIKKYSNVKLINSIKPLLYQIENPIVTIKKQYFPELKKMVFSMKQNTKYVFDLNIPVSITVNGVTIEKVFNLKNASESFTIKLEVAPTLIEYNKKATLFALIEANP
jgi:aminopeptidase N